MVSRRKCSHREKTLYGSAGSMGAGAWKWVHGTGQWGEWAEEGLEGRLDTGARVLSDWENKLHLEFVTVLYWALNITYHLEE